MIVRANPSGVSAIIDPAGRIVESVGLGEKGTLSLRAPLMDTHTFYLAFGDILYIGALILVILGSTSPLLARRRIRELMVEVPDPTIRV